MRLVHVIRKVANSLAADLLHYLLQLGLEDRDRVVAASASQCSGAVHEGATEEGEFGTRCECPSDVGSGSDATVHHDGDLIAALVCDRSQRTDR